LKHFDFLGITQEEASALSAVNNGGSIEARRALEPGDPHAPTIIRRE